MSNIAPAIKQMRQKPTKPNWLDLKVFKRANDFTYTDKSEEYQPGPPDRSKFPFHNAPWEQGNFLIRKDEPYFDSEDVQEEESDFDRGRKTAAVDIRKLIRIYQDQARRIDPNPADLYDVLYELGESYSAWVGSLENHKSFVTGLREELEPEEKDVLERFKKRLTEIRNALPSGDVNQQMIALDNGINEMHLLAPVLFSLGDDMLERLQEDTGEEFDRAFKEYEKLWDALITLLEGLGKSPISYEASQKTAAVDIKKLTKIYEDQAKGIQSDPADVYDVLHDLSEDYRGWLDWLNERIKEGPLEKDTAARFEERLAEIGGALKSKDVSQQIIAIDNAINEMHRYEPVLYLIYEDALDALVQGYLGDDPLVWKISESEYEEIKRQFDELWGKLDRLLRGLGRLPKQATRKTAAVDIRKLTKIYEDQAKSIQPDPADVHDVLYELGRYFFDYLEWYDTYDIELRPGEEQVIKNFESRWEEIDTAVASKDVNQQIIAIDNAINMLHVDFPVIAHLSMDAVDALEKKYWDEEAQEFTIPKEEVERAEEELEELWSKFYDLLEKLGKFPTHPSNHVVIEEVGPRQATDKDFFQFTPEDVRVQPYLNKPDVLKEREEKFQKFPKYPKEDITERDLSFAE